MSTITFFSDLNVGFLKQNNALVPRTGSFYIDVVNDIAEGFGVYNDTTQPTARQNTDTKHEYYFYLDGLPGPTERQILGVLVSADDLYNGYGIGMNFYMDALLIPTISMFVTNINALGPTGLPFTHENDITALIPDHNVIISGWCKVVIECYRNTAGYPKLTLYDKNGNLITSQYIGMIVPDNDGKVGIYMYNTSGSNIALDDWTVWEI